MDQWTLLAEWQAPDALAANSEQVMSVVLRLAGHAELELGIKLQEISRGLELALVHVRAIAGPQ